MMLTVNMLIIMWPPTCCKLMLLNDRWGYTYFQGALVKAIRSGDWVLLDEINLASTETLECLGGILESTVGSVVLMERGYVKVYCCIT